LNAHDSFFCVVIFFNTFRHCFCHCRAHDFNGLFHSHCVL
jgi:hypothetical protein